ncbi:MAG: hypothetical protein SGJ27_05325 [Candidatus Melainabacteria bacterium]|nr:hypothetical protein [Candidatus Melainabacteria bacterium]
MSLVINRRIRQLAVPLCALICLTACGSQDTTTSYDDVNESEAQAALGSDFTVPYYDKARLFSVKRSVSSMPASVTVTGSFHTKDDCPSVSDNYSRRLRIDNWVVTDIEKEPTKASFKAHKDKDECTMSATNDGGETAIVLSVKTPK